MPVLNDALHEKLKQMRIRYTSTRVWIKAPDGK